VEEAVVKRAMEEAATEEATVKSAMEEVVVKVVAVY
jgi:hypothetical protein